jgi:predicted metalloprotease
VWASKHDVEPTSIPLIELQADVMSGIWYGINDRPTLSALRRQVGPSFNRQIGIDDLVVREQHAVEQAASCLDWTTAEHGTSDQRDAAIKAGIQYGEDFSQASAAGAFKQCGIQIYDFSKATASQILTN